MIVRLMSDSLAAKEATVMYINSSVAGSASLYSSVEKVWKEINGSIPFEIMSLSDTYRAEYDSERRSYSLILSFTGIAAFISLLGIMGLLYLVNQRRTREIGIRKVFGSEIHAILLQQLKFILIVSFTSFLVSVPLSIIYLRKLLSVYAFRSDLNWYVFAVSIFLILIIITGLGVLQSLRTARTSPVVSLRHE
jgi:putative ABC transport system permease protein